MRIAIATLLLVYSCAVSAQTYPTKPVRFIVPYAPGGGADVMARIVAPRLGAALGQQIIIDNRGGAGGNIGSEAGAKAPPDGYTLLLGAAALTINVSLYSRLNFDPVKDLTPIALLAKSPNIVVVHPSLPVASVKDLIALARARPGQLNYASAGSGTTPHLAAELFKTMAKVQIVHVPYNGTSPAMVALMAGEVTLALAPALPVLPHVQSGRLRALAITSVTRMPSLPNLPTVSEAALPGFESAQWYGVLVPAGTPAAIVSRLNAEIVKIMRLPDVNEQMTRQGSIVVGSTPEEFSAYIRAEIDKWAKVVKASGAKVE
ncbi:MAG TPA: tripartite tricarboxylate transporter substrate binding protein [Burkholderiales bacterium]|nr:tripartite tricarboxylate transporter substrate binding protein [Burkholderiales bacterium]